MDTSASLRERSRDSLDGDACVDSEVLLVLAGGPDGGGRFRNSSNLLI